MAEQMKEKSRNAKSVPGRPKPVLYDETPSQITSHAFAPIGEWYTRCKFCYLSEAAHMETTLTGREHIHYYSDDNPED
jgi:hypothetical protein